MRTPFRRPALAAFVVAAGLVIAGCGYRPAGTFQAEGLAGTRVVDVAGETDVAFALARRLDLYGVPEPAADGSAARVLRILGEDFEQRQRTLAPDARTAEFELIGSARFELLDADGSTLIAPRTITADSIYLRDVNNLLGNRTEAERLKGEIREELVRRILAAVSVVSRDGAVTRPAP